MSEFPEWVEDRIGVSDLTYEQSKELHRKIDAGEIVPDIEGLMATEGKTRVPSFSMWLKERMKRWPPF